MDDASEFVTWNKARISIVPSFEWQNVFQKSVINDIFSRESKSIKKENQDITHS